MTSKKPDFDPLKEPEAQLAEMSDELLAFRRAGPVHDAEQAAILAEDFGGLTRRIDAHRRRLFEEIYAVELRFHQGQLSANETFEKINQVLIRSTTGAETAMAHFGRYRIDGDGTTLLPLPQCMDLVAARKVHSDLELFDRLDEASRQAYEWIDVLDAIAADMHQILGSEHLQQYWLEQLGYIEVESVLRWLETSLARVQIGGEEETGEEGEEEDDEPGEAPPPPRVGHPLLEYVPGTLSLDDEGLILARYTITLAPDREPIERTVMMARLATGSRYPWTETPPETLLGIIRSQEERLLNRLTDSGSTMMLFSDDDDLIEP